jgi:16S rRNA (guanine(527)-N(7))-methyltransferase RsmG
MPRLLTDEELGSAVLSACQTIESKALADAALPNLIKHFRLLYAWNQRINLTSIRDPIDGIRRHLVEGVAGAQLITPRPNDHLVDLGSGNGYPALPLLMIHQKLGGTLVEKTARKVDFLRAALRQTNMLDRVEVSESRVTSTNDVPRAATLVTMRGFPEPQKWIRELLATRDVRCVVSWLGSDDERALRSAYEGTSVVLGEGKLVATFLRDASRR